MKVLSTATFVLGIVTVCVGAATIVLSAIQISSDK
jgi:hypothetical protein